MTRRIAPPGRGIEIPQEPTPNFLLLLDDELRDSSFPCPHSDRLYWAKRIYKFIADQGKE